MNLSATRTLSDGPQLRTILLTDLVGSTGLVERLGDVPASALFREHDHLVLELQQRWRGRLIDRSDGLLLLFERAIDGLGFALDYTRGLREIGKAHGVEVQARAGLHVGEVLTWKNSEAAVQFGAKPLEVEGLAKPMAARLMSMARPGQILLSAMAEPLARRAARELGERGRNLLWKSYGRWRFKGVPEALEIHEVGEVGIAPLRAPGNAAKAWRDVPLWRRPAALAAEVVLLAGLAVGSWFVTRPQPAIAFSERDWVVVADLRNLTGETVLDDSLEQAFRISLEQSRYVNVLSDMKARDTVARMQRPPDTPIDRAVASEIAIRDGARAVILPTVSEVGGRVRISAEVIDPHTQTTVHAESADGTGAGSALTSIDTVTAALREKLGEALASIENNSEPLPQVTTSNLDALRAYALGQAAFGGSNYRDAQSFYARAVQLDDEFALAHIGLLRALNAQNDLESGVVHLRRASELREHLTPRDQLYLDAWIAQIDAPGEVLDKWRQMSELYPDYFPASANTGYAFHELNRFEEGLPYAQRATSKQYEFSLLSWDLLGRLALGLEDYRQAERGFASAGAAQGRPSAMRLAETFAAQRRFEEAERTWKPANPVERGYFGSLTIYLDAGRRTDAAEELRALQDATADDAARARALLLPAATLDWLEGREEEALTTLAQAIDSSLEAASASSINSVAYDEYYLAIAGALLAQRMNDRELAAQVLEALQRDARAKAFAPVWRLATALRANARVMEGDSAEAITLLMPMFDGSEPQLAHGVLLEALIAEDNLEEALVQAQWLTQRRGRAYSEMGCGWCQQALNVADTNLAYLAASELLATMGRQSEAREALKSFDSHWPPAMLPDHLRVRRAALVSTLR